MLTHVTSGLDLSLSVCTWWSEVSAHPIFLTALSSSFLSGVRHPQLDRVEVGGSLRPRGDRTTKCERLQLPVLYNPRLSASSVESHKDLQTHYRQISLVPSHSFPLSGISPQLQKGRSFTNVFSASTHTLSLSYTQKKRKDYITSYLMDFVKPLVAGLSFIRSGIENRRSSCQTVPILHRTFRKCIYLPRPLPSCYTPGGSIKRDIYSVCS